MSLIKKSFFHGIARIFLLPRLSIPLILTLGLTLGAVLSVIAISSTLLYQPLQGIKNEPSLHTFEYRFKVSETMSISYWNMSRLASFKENFSDLGEWAGITPSTQNITIKNTAYATTRYNASSNILDVLGTQLLLGDDVTIASPNKYVWISESLWETAYAGIKSAIGQQLTVNNQNYIIAGIIEDVMAIKSNEAILNQQVWFISNLTEVATQKDDIGNISNEIDFLLLKNTANNVTFPNKDQVKEWLTGHVNKNSGSEGNANVQQFLAFFNNVKKEIISASYRSNMLGDSESLLIALFAAVVGLLLMATLNLLNLFIAHYQSRTKEFAIQISLGASLLKVKLLVLLENLPSFLLAALSGLLVTGWALKSLPLIAGDNLPMIDSININNTTVLASFILVIILSVLFSALALVDIDKHALANNLNSSGKGIQAQSNQWLSRILMVAQLAIASILLTASVMIALQSYQAVYQDLGYDLGNSYNLSLVVSDEDYLTKLQDVEKYNESEIKKLLSEVSNTIENKIADSRVVVPSIAPLSNSLQAYSFQNEHNNNEQVLYQSKSLSSDFFSTFKIKIIAGANLSQTQIDNDEGRVVIDEAMAKAVFPKLSYQEVIGKTMQLRNPETNPPVIISGIVSNVIRQAGLTNFSDFPAVYSHRIRAFQNLQFTIMMPPSKVITAEMLEKELQRQFPRLSDLTVQTLNEIWDEQTLSQRVSMWVVLAMTALTLLLAAIGVAGLTQMTTNHRKYELAVRMATGAKQMKLVNFILKDALWMLLIGLGLGFAISVIGYEQLQAHLEMLPLFNWFAMSVLDIGLIAIVVISVMVPAWRVISADPMQALRQE